MPNANDNITFEEWRRLTDSLDASDTSNSWIGEIDDIIRHRDGQFTGDSGTSALSGDATPTASELEWAREALRHNARGSMSDRIALDRAARRAAREGMSFSTSEIAPRRLRPLGTDVPPEQPRPRDRSSKKCTHTGGPQYNRLRFTSSLEGDGRVGKRAIDPRHLGTVKDSMA